jgi:cyclophilin family peptidyl-prolyl cis-trans isomerase
MLDNIASQRGLTYSAEQRARYIEVGGTPQLDGEYTVFGEVVEGLDVIDKIAAVQTGQANRPVNDVKMKIRMAN